MNYDELINSAILYIINNIDEKISIEDIAENCYISKYHFSRIFKASVGETPYQFIKRIRLERAALQISTYDNISITDVATEYGYESANFTNAFKKHFQTSPVSLRKELVKRNLLKNCSLYHEEYPILNYEHFEKNITYKTIEAKKVYYKRYIGHYRSLPIYWESFINTYGEYNKSNYLEISYNNPTLSDENRCVMDLCIESDEKVNGLSEQIIAGGKYAIYNYKGNEKGIFPAYQGIFTSWLANNNNNKLRNVPLFMEYLSILKDDFDLNIYIALET